MKLILSDRSLSLPPEQGDIHYIDLSGLKIANCVGCFGCWTKTPGRCVIRDDATRVYPLIAQSDQLLYVSRIFCGSYDVPMKTMLERAIPIQQAFIRIHHGETHHVQRQVVPKKAVIVGYGASSPQEEALFRQLIARNTYNMAMEETEVICCEESQVEAIVKERVEAWKN